MHLTLQPDAQQDRDHEYEYGRKIYKHSFRLFVFPADQSTGSAAPLSGWSNTLSPEYPFWK